MGPRIVLDTNVLVAALRSGGGSSRQVLRLCLEGKMEPLMGLKLFLECEDVLERKGLFEESALSHGERRAVFAAFLRQCRWTEVYFLWRPNLPDEGDNHLVELAVAGGAEMLVTHNARDFLGELLMPGLAVVTPGAFLRGWR